MTRRPQRAAGAPSAPLDGELVARGGLVLACGGPACVPDAAAGDDSSCAASRTSAGAFVGLANFGELPARRPGFANSAHEHARVRDADDALHRAARLCRSPTRSSAAASRCKALWRNIALIPILAPSLLAALSFIYLFGNQGIFKGVLGWFGLGTIYGLPGMVLAMTFCRIPARRDDPARRVVVVGRAPVRGGRLDGHVGVAQVRDDHAAGRPLWPDLGGDGRVHDGGVRVRRAEGHRRQLQRAGDRHLQAGDRPAELPDRRRRRADPAAAGGRGVPGRLRGARAPEDADVGPQRRRTCRGRCAVRDRAAARIRAADVGGDAAGDRHGGVRLVREGLAVQPVVHAESLHLRLRGGGRGERVPQQPDDGRAGARSSAPRSRFPARTGWKRRAARTFCGR